MLIKFKLPNEITFERCFFISMGSFETIRANNNCVFWHGYS